MPLASNNLFTHTSTLVLQTILQVTMVENSVKFNSLPSIPNLYTTKETTNSRQNSTSKSTKNVIWLQIASNTCLRVIKVATPHYHSRLGSFNNNSNTLITKTKTTMMGRIIKGIFSSKNMIDVSKVNVHSSSRTHKFLRPKFLAQTIKAYIMRRMISLLAQVDTISHSTIISTETRTNLDKTNHITKIWPANSTIIIVWCYLKTINRVIIITNTS
jgi:hypothetical protein